MTRPAVRKNCVGEAKESNAEAGLAKRWDLRPWRVWISHVGEDQISSACSDPGSSKRSSSSASLGYGEVATSVQSKMAFLVNSPAILVGSDLEAKLSVRASEVASVPPRNEPYISIGLCIRAALAGE